MTTRFVGPVHVDTDCGVDDALALVLVAQLAELHSVTTTWGNCTAAQAAVNARHVLGRTRARNVPVIASGQVPPTSWAPSDVHGPDGLGGVVNLTPDPPQSLADAAPEAIVDFARRVGGRGRLLAIAPLTNIAAALKLDPRALAALDEVVVMAGQGSTPRQQWLDTTGDTNTRHDPDAMNAVLASTMRLTFVGIDQTRRVLLGEPAFGATDFGLHLLAISRRYGRERAASYGYAESGPGWRVPAHDATAATVLLEPGDETICATGPMCIDNSSGSSVLRARTHSERRGGHHRFVAVGPAPTTVERLVAEAFAS